MGLGLEGEELEGEGVAFVEEVGGFAAREGKEED